MEVNVENIDQQLENSRDNGENLAELLALFDYFIKHTPEGRQVSREIERDWQETCDRLRESKRLIGADFSLYEWLTQIRKELLSTSKPIKVSHKPKIKATRSISKQPQKFRGIEN